MSDLEEYQVSDLSNVDYIGVGPMYHTGSKSDAKAPVGPEMIQTLRTKVQDFQSLLLEVFIQKMLKQL